MLADQIKHFRTRQGLSQAELAKKLHVVRQTVSKWEQGLSVPDAQMLVALAQALDTTVAQLLGQDAPDAPQDATIEQLARQLQDINACLADQARRRKRCLRAVCIVLLVLAMGMLAYQSMPLWLRWCMRMAPVVGETTVIGGADGPTAIWVRGAFSLLPSAAALATALVCGLWLYRNRS